MKIEIEHVSKKIKDALVLDDVCMTLESGNIYGFQGVNGSGKTMLMRAVSGLMYPTSGTISIDGINLQLVGTAHVHVKLGSAQGVHGGQANRMALGSGITKASDIGISFHVLVVAT